VAAARVQPEPDRFAAARPGAGEHVGQPAVPGDVDGVLVAPAAERDVGYRAGQVTCRFRPDRNWWYRVVLGCLDLGEQRAG
jgi:hypothetical protein